MTTNGKITTTCHNSWASTPAEPSKTPEEHVIIHENDNDCTRIRTYVIEMLLVLTLTDVNLSNNNGYVSAILISGIDDTPGAVINNVTTRTCITHINRVNALSNGRMSINGCVNELQRLNNSWHIINGGSNISPHACNDNGIREPINSCIITSNDINTLVEDCTHPSMGSTYIMSAMIRCVSTRLHITWHYSPDIAQRTTISGAAPIIGHINLVLMCDERDLAYETLDWNNTANAYTAEYGYALINVIDYLSDAHKNISAYAQHGTAYIVLGYNCSCTSGINTALTLRTGSIHRYGIPPDTTDINHGRSNNGINYSEIGIMFVDGTLVSSITYLPDTIQHLVHHNINNSTINTDDNAFGNNDNISIHLFVDHMLDYVANNHESMSRINSNYKAKNTHTDAGYELSGCIVTLDYGQFNKSYVYTYEPGCDDGIDTALTCTSNSYMSNDANRTCGRSSSSNEIVAFKYNTIVQSQDHGSMDTSDKFICVCGVENCYLFGMRDCYIPWRTLKRRQEEIGSSRSFDTRTTHGELESRVCHSTSRRGLGTIIGLWTRHMHNQLNDRMTKAYRRGVTCTGEYGFVWYLVVPLFVRKSSFERELESRIHLA